MKLYSVYDEEFRSYGQVHGDFDTSEILSVLEETEITDHTVYVPEDPSLQSLSSAGRVERELFGGIKTQLGWCNGHNTKLNCLEYHRSSEFNLGTRDFILLLARQDQIKEGVLDTSLVKAFLVPKGLMIEVYATTLHYAPCHKDKEGFQVLVALPKGTNYPLNGITSAGCDSKLLWATGKWLLAHPDSDEAKQGAYIGLTGENIDISKDI